MLALTGGIATVGLGGIVSGTSDKDESGDDDPHDHDHEHELGQPESHVEVAMTTDEVGHHFVPHVVHVEEGGTVTWVLDNGVHDVVAYHPDNANLLPSSAVQRVPEDAYPWASDVYATAGETFAITFEREGIYDYTCTVGGGHGHGGRHGHGDHHGHGGRHGRRSWHGRDEWAGSDSRGEYDGRRGSDGRSNSGGGHCHGPGQERTGPGDGERHGTHEAAGMVGRVIVGWPEPDPGREPALRQPSADLPAAARREFATFDERTRAAFENGDSH